MRNLCHPPMHRQTHRATTNWAHYTHSHSPNSEFDNNINVPAAAEQNPRLKYKWKPERKATFRTPKVVYPCRLFDSSHTSTELNRWMLIQNIYTLCGQRCHLRCVANSWPILINTLQVYKSTRYSALHSELCRAGPAPCLFIRIVLTFVLDILRQTGCRSRGLMWLALCVSRQQ